MRLIQLSLTNGLIIFNACCAIDKKMSIKDFSLSVVENYLKKARKDITSHVIQKTNSRTLEIVIHWKNAKKEATGFAFSAMNIIAKLISLNLIK